MTIVRELRRALHVSGGALTSALACAVIAGGGLDPSALQTPSAGSMMLLASVAVLVVTAIARRLRFEAPSARSQRASFWLAAAPAMADMEMSFALVGASYAVIAVSGCLESPLYPLLYGVIAFSVSFQSRAGAWAAIGAAGILELSFFLRQPFGMGSAVPMLLHVGFAGGAASAHALFLRGLITYQRRQNRRRLEAEVREQRESVRDYRLISAALGAESRAPRSRADEEHILAVGGVQAIRASIFYTLNLLKRSLPARTCVLLWMNESGEALKIKELVSDSDDLAELSRVPAAGVLGAIIRDRAPLLVARTKPGLVPYYRREWSGAFAGVPVKDGPHLRGVLCANRDEPFDERELALLVGATEQIVRCIQSEQVFLAVERAKYEHERFYHASAMLCRALTLEEVMETAFDAAAEIVEYDIAAIAIYEPDRKTHQVYSVRMAPGAESIIEADKLAGLTFRDNAGLASMVVKNKHYLPAGGELRDVTTPVYVNAVRLNGAESLLVMPLLCGDEAIGTFMLASRRRHRFGKDVREMLGVIANQVAVSIQNGLMYKKMETMATTDGLTGLTNRRAFQERFDQMLDRAERHGHHAALLVCDVDFFKKVNDTYGHAVGDEVLKLVARVLKTAVRKIDIPARLGGEEFVVVSEATGLDGAMQLAERIRNDVAALTIDSDKGPFKITMSLGVATFPDDGRDRETLFEHADQALYHAKQSGRNRSIAYQHFVAEKQARKAS